MGPLKVRETTEEEGAWIDEQLHKFKFDEKNSLKKAVNTLVAESEAIQSGKDQKEESKLLEFFEDLQELFEINSANDISFCNMGGLTPLLVLIIAHSNDKVRKAACRIFNSITANNPKVQIFATKVGAINLATQLEREKTPLMREAILGSLTAFLKQSNFPGKVQYVAQMDGLTQLSKWICLDSEEAKLKYGEGPQAHKIRMKLFQLLNDLVLNDDSIINDGLYVRQTIAKDEKLMNHMLQTLESADLEAHHAFQIREQVYSILYRINQIKPDISDVIEDAVWKHCQELEVAAKADEDKKEQLMNEFSLAGNVLESQDQEPVKNFPDIKPTELREKKPARNTR